MSSIEYIYEGDLCDSKAQLIAHQCNCSSIVKCGAGLYSEIAKNFPYADFYPTRSEDSKPGTIKVYGDKKLKQRLVLAMFSQFHPGPPTKKDSTAMREKWFDDALSKIAKINGLKSIAFPYKIGCGLAQGDWDIYKAKLEDFSKENPHLKIYIISNESRPSLIEESSESEEELIDDESSEKENIKLAAVDVKECSDSDTDDADTRSSSSEEKEETSSDEIINSPREESTKNPDDLDYEFLKWVWEHLQTTPFIDSTYFIEAYGKKDVIKKTDIMKKKDWIWKTSSILEYTKFNIPKSYEKFFNEFIEGGGFDELNLYLKKESQSYTLFPELKNIYKAFELCPIDNLKVVAIGQDPYHIDGAAMGVAFGHNKGVRLQPSLRNIYKAVEKDGFKADYENGDITKWCTQGVFFINTALTVRAGDAGSHTTKSKNQKGPWDYFINQLFRFINDTCDHVVVLMWGVKAQEYKDLFSVKKHHIITAPHPAASSYDPTNSGFVDALCFSKTNRKLKTWGYEPIDWNMI